ncbi:MAG: C45 family autoproteolytic acyltransferase/hydrolase [Polyangiaceae bacterium]
MKQAIRKRWIGGLLGLFVVPISAHFGVKWLAQPTPPALTMPPAGEVEQAGTSRRFGHGEALVDARLHLVRLEGSSEEIGVQHTKLLYDSMVQTERRFLNRYRQYVPNPAARFVLTDLALFRFFDIDHGMTLERRREIGAMAASFTPDPFADFLPTYQRLVYLNAIYDISLAFEGSPLLGCTTFFVAGSKSQHTLLARNFDFEVDSIFDEKKTLFIVKEAGKIPYVSVSWPGLVGSVTGVNRHGLALVVHGGRAGDLARKGEPVLHILRDVLSTATNVEEAYTELVRHPIMVSHVIIMADRSGHAEAVERVPGRAPYHYRLADRAVVTNHLVGPSADDPKNVRIRAKTSTLDRQQRGQQLLSAHDGPIEAETLISFLRDRKGINGVTLPLGDRRALGALIAAHGVAVDLTAGRLWVGGTPTLLGPYYGLDLETLFDDSVPLERLLDDAPSIAADPLLNSPEYAAYRKEHER